ncbi:MAG: hypothetical protein NZM10_03010 [Fimbriimonadales bacterium]|nr:hypothetical protein [Fimbriimonadales bacterium]
MARTPSYLNLVGRYDGTVPSPDGGDAIVPKPRWRPADATAWTRLSKPHPHARYTPAGWKRTSG